jgi:vitamin K-dependent gamma-carboxylase-like protein
MVPTIKEWGLSPWNPICCRGTSLPANLLIVAKVVIACFIVFAEWHHFKSPFLPFLPFFDLVRPFELFPVVLHILFIFGSFFVLFNRYVRTGCLMVGLAVIIAILAARFEYRNHAVFASFILILIGLHNERHCFALIRLQVAIVYFGAGLNKVLDPDWLNGQFFEFWTHGRLKHAPFMLIASYFPPMMLSQLFSWVTIFLEFSVAIGFLIPRLYILSIWLGIFLHGSIMIFTVDSEYLRGLFDYFFPVAAASYLAFFKWPEATGNMQYDPRHPFSLWLKKASKWIDWDRFFNWEVFSKPSDAGVNHPYLQLKVNGKNYENFKAIQVFLLLNPLTYFMLVSGFLFLVRVAPFIASLISGSHYIPFGALIKTLYVLAPIIFFSPLFVPWIDSLIKNGEGKKS